jgi:hypothetical protein
MNDFSSCMIGDFYTPQPKQHEFHESQARRSAQERKRGII